MLSAIHTARNMRATVNDKLEKMWKKSLWPVLTFCSIIFLFGQTKTTKDIRVGSRRVTSWILQPSLCTYINEQGIDMKRWCNESISCPHVACSVLTNASSDGGLRDVTKTILMSHFRKLWLIYLPWLYVARSAQPPAWVPLEGEIAAGFFLLTIPITIILVPPLVLSLRATSHPDLPPS